MSKKKDRVSNLSLETIITHSGRPDIASDPFVNPPVVRASTVLFESLAATKPGKSKYSYGRRGTPTSEALTDLIAEIEGAAGALVTPSGLAAVSVALLSVLKTGDHLIVSDSAYGPTRHFCDGVLKRFGVETSYCDPGVGGAIEALIKPNTRAIFMEVPGSLTFEMQDVPAIVAVAKDRGLTTLIDNTWATPVYFRPLDLGVDISLMAATKYVVGHSDAMLGTIACAASVWPKVNHTYGDMGMFTGPDDMYLALRGLRTMALRLERHFESALTVARWLEHRPEVARVLHPALPAHPGHAIWKRDFRGASGLFAFELKPVSPERVAAMVDGLDLFGIGYSWGGYESLITVPDLTGIRTATAAPAGPLVRLHIGLEDPQDLIADLDAGLRRLTEDAGTP